MGIIQVGKITLEILPKADKNALQNADLWHSVLLDMLRECRLLKVESLSSARLQLRNNSILDLYFEIFLKEMEILVRKGLCKSYRLEQGNQKTWKGKLLFKQQIRKNHIQKQRFFTQHTAYDYDHLVNQILYKALLVLQKMIIKPELTTKLHRLLDHFPPVQEVHITEREFQQIYLNRKLQVYQNALEIARLLIFNYSPDIKSGRHQLIAILFDMNLLFEEYVYQQLKRLTFEVERLQVKRQESRFFWNRRRIRPDILIDYKGETVVLDTKWKLMKKASPSMEDLRQVFIYCQYFNAQRSILLYPKVKEIKDLPPIPYHPNQSSTTSYFCQIQFLSIIKDGKLNKELGVDILKAVEQELV